MKQLDFNMQHQEHSNWCWAAVSVSVEQFFSPGKELRQCGMAHLELGFRCCDEPERRCNQPHRLDPPLERVNRLRGRPIAEVLSFAKVQEEIDAGRPVCVRIRWRDGGGHFVVITGYDVSPRGVEQVIVDDPFYRQSRIPIERLRSSYQVDHGKWTATFLLSGSRPVFV